jgi:hypothetical protein
MANVGLQAFMVQIIQTVIFWVFLVLMKGQTQKKSFTLEDGASKLLPIHRYRPTRPYGRTQAEYQGHKVSKYNL